VQFAVHRFAQGRQVLCDSMEQSRPTQTPGDLDDYVIVQPATLAWLKPPNASGCVSVNDCGATSVTSSTIKEHSVYQCKGNELVEPKTTLRLVQQISAAAITASSTQPSRSRSSSSDELLKQNQIAGEQELIVREFKARSRSSVTSGIDVTPLTTIQVSPQQYLDQQLRVARVATRLNLTFSREFFERYISTFGFIDESWAGFGSDLWLGMHRLLAQYTSRRSFQPTHLGWFVLPVPFSKHQAGRPRSEDAAGPATYYPAFFQDYGSDGCYMACLHIMWVGCKSWCVDKSRMVNAPPL